MNQQQPQQKRPSGKAPPPSAFLPPPPLPPQYGSNQQQQQRRGHNYNRQPSSGGDGASAATSKRASLQQPPPLTTEGTRQISGSAGMPGTGAAPAGGVKQFAPPAAVPTYFGPQSGSSGAISGIDARPGAGENTVAGSSVRIAAPTSAMGTAAVPSLSSSNAAAAPGEKSQPSYPARYPVPAAATAPGYTAAQFPSPYLPTSSVVPSGDSSLKARNVATSGGNSDQGYLLTSNTSTTAGSSSGLMGSRKTHSSGSTSPNTECNNNKSIAFLILPPLLLLFLYEMSSSLSLLVLLCAGLIIYSFDLANVGDPSNPQSNQRGFYTMCAIWFSWILLSLVVGYDALFLSDEGNNAGSGAFVVSNNVDLSEPSEEGGVSSSSSGGTSRLFGLALLLTKLSMSIILLFNLATWITLQFRWLPSQMPMVAKFLERILHATLPPVSAAMVAYGILTTSSLSLGGVDSMAMLIPHVFAFHLALGIFLVGSASSMMFGNSEERDGRSANHDGGDSKKKGKDKSTIHVCAIHPREGRRLSYLLVFLPPLIHLITFRQRILNSYASWDDLFDLILISTVPYTLHYLLASNAVFDERWRRSLPWALQMGTSPADTRTLRGASVPMTISLLAAMAFQHRYLVPLCARASYIINGHEGIISSTMATAFLTLGTILAYATIWFFGRKTSNGDEFLLGEYHEDAFQLLLAASSVFYGLSCSPKWTFLPVPMLFAESLALWVITKQLRYAFLTLFVFFTVGTIVVAYRLTFLNENIEILPGKSIVLKKFADVAMCASMWLIMLVGLVSRAPGGYGVEFMKKYDVTGICLTLYGLLLIVMEFALLREPMPLYSRDNFEVGRVAVYSPAVAYFTGFLTLVITWHVKSQKLIKDGSVMVSTSVVVGKMLAVLIESSLVMDAYDSLGMLYLRWAVASLLLIAICAPYLLKPIHVKMSMMHTRKRRDPNAKANSSLQGLPQNASLTVVLYCAVLLPLVIVSSVRLVLEPLIGLLTGQNNTGGAAGYYSTSPKLSEIIGYSASLWGISVLSMINHFLPDGGADVWRRVSALTFIMGLFVSFAAPAFPGASSSPQDSVFQSVSSLDDTENDAATGGWGLVSAFLAILLAMSGPLELREMKDASGRRDTRQLLRLMIFGMMFGCGLSWFITMQSMSKDIFIPIFVTTFSCMAMSTLGTVAAVMGFFLDAKEFVEAEQIANVWAVVAFPVFFVISSISLSAHAHPFGIGGWASTYLSVCGLLAGAFCVMVRLREEKSSTTRGYGNMSCVISWLCAISVVYGRYGVAGVGVVGTTSVAGIPASVLGTILCSPILLLLEGEGSSEISGRKKYQLSPSTKSNKKGIVLSTLTRSNWFAPLLAGIIAPLLVTSLYAVFLRGCGLSKISLIFGTGDVIKSQEDVFSHVYGSRTTGMGALDDVAKMAQKSVVHTRTMVAAAKLSGSGIWTSSNLLGPLMHFLGLVGTLPSLQCLVSHSWYGSASAPTSTKVTLYKQYYF